MLSDVEIFAEKFELKDILPELRKGALAAQDPVGFDSIPELDEEDRALLWTEIEHRWKQPKILYVFMKGHNSIVPEASLIRCARYFAIVLSSIAAAIQGPNMVTGGLPRMNGR